MTIAAPPAQQPAAFLQVIAVTFGIEGDGKFSVDPHDPGNWTGGRVGEGVARGTRWGFSSAAFPSLDLDNLDRAQATGMAYSYFWLPAKCSEMPDSLAVLVFDATFQHGVSRAVEMLQWALGERADGVFGPWTLGALHRAVVDLGHVKALCIGFQVQRLLHMAEQSSWQRDRDGLARRLLTLMTVSAHFDDEQPGDAS